MMRITSIILTLIALFCSSVKTQAQNLRSIESRILSVEDRLRELEIKLAEKTGASIPVTPPAKFEIEPKVPVIAPPETQTYVIREGDSLGGIARTFGVPRQALLDANKMTEGQPIYIGETLVIPTAPVQDEPISKNGIIHVVGAGDTLTRIAKKYGTTVPAIKQENKLNSDVIGTGQKLVIPGSQSTKTDSELPKPLATDKSGTFHYDNPLLRTDETYGYYAVQKNDSLYALARDFFTTMQELQRLNQMDAKTIIYPGTELVVPTKKYNEFHQTVVQN
jgi:LysM repeat protein